MAKRSVTDFLVLLLYSVPYAFLAMYGDSVYGIEWLYSLPLCCFPALAWYCGKQKRTPLAAGNLISCGLSIVLAYHFLMDESLYFKPFGVLGMVGFLSALSLSVQLLIWRRKRGDREPSMFVQFFEVLAMLFLSTVIFVFTALIFSHIFLW